MPRIAFLTIENMGDFVADDQLALDPLAQRGYEVEMVRWDASVDWSVYHAAVIRTTWDYQDRLEKFNQSLERIEASGCRLFNPLEVVRWNANKRYMADLADRGVPIVPTLFRNVGDSVDLAAFFAHFATHDIVIKPTIGACAFDTFRIRNVGGTARVPVNPYRPPTSTTPSSTQSRFRGDVPTFPLSRESEAVVADALRGREYMVQPFVPEILDPGETSLFYFNGRYSHAVLKTPRSGDFRVQEEHGGVITPADPPLDLVEACGAVARLFEPELLYARVDIVRTGEVFLLMELELIEPALYFRIVPGSAERFADAVAARLS